MTYQGCVVRAGYDDIDSIDSDRGFLGGSEEEEDGAHILIGPTNRTTTIDPHSFVLRQSFYVNELL
jgi:hypothetical protein